MIFHAKFYQNNLKSYKNIWYVIKCFVTLQKIQEYGKIFIFTRID